MNDVCYSLLIRRESLALANHTFCFLLFLFTFFNGVKMGTKKNPTNFLIEF